MERCSQVVCTETATVRMFWPGKQCSPLCPTCADRAKDVAAALGFELVVEPLPPAPADMETSS